MEQHRPKTHSSLFGLFVAIMAGALMITINGATLVHAQTPEQYHQAAAALQAGNFSSACSQYEALHKAAPTEPHALYGLAVCARHTGDPGKATRILKGLFHAQPNFAPGQLLMGELLDEQGQASAANKHYAEYARLAKLQGIPLPKDPKIRIRIRQASQ